MSSEEADSTSPHPSPSSTSSLASSTLPTPSQPYASRQGSLSYAPTSPRLGRSASMSSPPPSNSMEQGKTLDRPPVIKTSSSSSSTTDLPEMIISFPSPTDSKSGSSHESKRSPKRSATSPQFRAPPPPPIIIRRPTDVSARPLNLSQHGSTARNVPSPTYANHWGGLNISGLPREPLSSTSEPSPLEETDSLPELLQTPHRAFFANASAEGAPISPAWQPLEASPRLHQALASGTDPSPCAPSSTSSHSADPPIPFSPLGAPRRSSGLFEPTPQHGIHARNLSNFFPRPGQSSRDGLMPSPEPLQDAPHVLPAGKERKVFGGKGDWSFGHNANEVSSDSLSSEWAETKRSKRRGHHHKHSLSHNFFSFLDPTQTNPALASNKSPTSPLSPRTAQRPMNTPHKVPMLLPAPDITSSPTLSPLPPSKNTAQTQMLGSFAALEFLIGAGLWVEGQMSGWRCLAGLGYLVVFDAMGVGVQLIGKREVWSNIRRPYGSARFLSLLYFAQSIFLVFAAVYIAKEALEEVLLGSGGHDHAGGHSHAEGSDDGDERPFPRFLLASATLASIVSGAMLDNHGKLVEAVGPLFLPTRYISLKMVQRYASLLSNPFSISVVGFSLAVLVASFTVHSPDAFDSALSLLLTVVTSALAYPPTLAFGHVLLQTAPQASAAQMVSLRKALKDVGADPRVLGVGTVRCWSIGATTPSDDAPTGSSWWSMSPSNSTSSSPRSALFGDSPAASPTRSVFSNRQTDPGTAKIPLVVSLMVHVHPDASDRDILDVTKYAWVKVSDAVGLRSKGGLGEGEVSVGVCRGWDGVEGGGGE
ncbi:hypothetical protein DB88DRAFT_541095 [Papiliotrema laurentii]|uniref:Uncharacterized protein n=1 Tax=Papiliotrema laurentii TaxID=5418 RepID=A0AAD9FKQ3_PAPLA|nr:hypothetical protein DB88DRAFT_541095 [Papiliotrema laurentii]